MKERNPIKILITGGCSGIGMSVANYLSKFNYEIIICTRSNESAKYAKSVFNSNKNIKIELCDVSDHSNVKSLFAKLKKIDVLINNAGVVGPGGKLLDIDMEEWFKAVSINLNGSLFCAIEALKLFSKKGKGIIIQMSGGGATKAMPMFSSYCAGKSAVVRLMETIAIEYKDIANVFCMAPGAIKTNLTKRVVNMDEKSIGTKNFRDFKNVMEGKGDKVINVCELTNYLITRNPNQLSGRLVSAIWDDFRNWTEHDLNDIETKDILKLKRII